MMSKGLEVPTALKALVQAAVPGATVLGLDGSDAYASRVPAGGRVIVEYGDPGPAEVDLSPPTYNYQHAIPVQLAALPSRTLNGAQVISAMLDAISDAVVADRTLGGLVDYLDAFAPETSDQSQEGALVARIADLVFTATYSTSRPL